MTVLGIEGLAVLGGFGQGLTALARAVEHGAPQVGAADVSGLSDYLSVRALRRVDHFSRLSLLGAFEVFKDAGLEPGTSDMDGLGIVFCTGFGPARLTFDFLDSIIEHGADLSSPLAFSHSVHNVPAASIAIQAGITGPCTTVCQFETSVAAGLMTAGQWLVQGRVRRVLFAAVDERTQVLDHCRQRLSPTNGPTLPVGEAGVFLCLNADENSRYGSVRGATVCARDDAALAAQGETFVSGRGVGRLLPSYPDLTSHAAVLGVLPVAMGLDMALAVAGQRESGADSIHCLSLDAYGFMGRAEVHPGGAR